MKCTMRTRINQKTIDRLEKLNKYILQERQDDKFYSQDALINEALTYFFESKGVKDEYTFQDLKDDRGVLEYRRVSTHITKSPRLDLQTIGKFLKKEGIIKCKRRPTIDQVVQHLITYFQHSDPEINLMLEENRYLSQKVAIDNERKKVRGY